MPLHREIRDRDGPHVISRSHKDLNAALSGGNRDHVPELRHTHRYRSGIRGRRLTSINSRERHCAHIFSTEPNGRPASGSMRFGGRRAGPALKPRYVVKTIEQLARETAPCHLQTPPFFRCQRTPGSGLFSRSVGLGAKLRSFTFTGDAGRRRSRSQAPGAADCRLRHKTGLTQHR